MIFLLNQYLSKSFRKPSFLIEIVYMKEELKKKDLVFKKDLNPFNLPVF